MRLKAWYAVSFSVTVNSSEAGASRPRSERDWLRASPRAYTTRGGGCHRADTTTGRGNARGQTQHAASEVTYLRRTATFSLNSLTSVDWVMMLTTWSAASI